MKEDSRKIQVMAIVNLTPDSFFEGSRIPSSGSSFDTGFLLDRISSMIENGADIIDIGACSTRPGSTAVDEKEEWRRLHRPIIAIRAAFPDIPISIDTFRSSVVSRVSDTIGPVTVNDISGCSDPDMLPLVSRNRLPYIFTHNPLFGNLQHPGPEESGKVPPGGDPARSGRTPGIHGITEKVLESFRRFDVRAREAGLEDWIADPGFGFGKSLEENWQLIDELPALKSMGKKIVAGVSRKSMIYKLLGITPEESLPATEAVHLLALEKGADILRVHDVREAAQTVRIYKNLLSL